MFFLSAASRALRAPRVLHRPQPGFGLVIALSLAIVPAFASGASATPRSADAARSVPADAVAGTLEGIDVSHWQNTIDWTKVAGAGKKFAIIKATDGTTYIDPMYATNHSQAKAVGMWTGAYHYARPSTAANDAILQADWFAAHINLGAGDLIPALDLEESGGMSITVLQNWVGAFLGEVTLKTGVRPMIYSSPSFWKNNMGDSRALADAGYKTLWVAHWGVSSPTVPAANWGGRGWTFWQYTSSGTVPGITGRVDLDRFNGLDLMPQAYSSFKLAASHPAGYVKQGASSSANVTILRTNFTTEVALDVTGLPAGTTATFAANPTTDRTASLVVTTPADPTATPVGTYPLTITGVGGELTRTTTLNLVVADGIAPTVVAPTTWLPSGRTLGTTTVPVRVSFSATDPSGIASYGLQRSVNAGSWTTTVGSTTATGADTSIPFSGNALQRVRATDKKANTSGYVTGRLAKVAVFQQTTSAMTWLGTWGTSSWSGASGGNARFATTRNAKATFTFTGSGVAWVAAKGPTRGSASVYVDGHWVRAVSLYASTSQSRAIVFSQNWTTIGTHTVTVVVAGTAGHPRVDVDAFVRLTVL